MPRPCKMTFVLLTLKVMSESRVTWPTSVPILVFLLLRPLFSRLRPDVRDSRQTSDVRRASSLNAPALWGRGHNNRISIAQYDSNFTGARGRSDQCSVKV